MLCHKHFGLSRLDNEGNTRVLYINESLYERSPHGRIECNDCHQGITEVPHKDVEAVDCTTECHMKEPSGNKKFSHKLVEKRLKKSAHSPYDEDGKLKKYADDYPGCRDCHEQPLFREFTLSNKHNNVSAKGVKRCKSCHTEGDFASE